MIDAIRQWARRIKQDAVMLWFACRDPRTPRLPKIICMVAVAYALSPIDLIPDFIPVLGFLDDAILVPAMIWLAVKLLPAQAGQPLGRIVCVVGLELIAAVAGVVVVI